MSSNSSDTLDGLNPAISSANISRTSVRPRNRRLISVNEEDGDDATQATTSRLSSSLAGLTPPQSRGTTPSPYPSRRGSPGFSRLAERNLDGRYRDEGERLGGKDVFQAYGSSQTSSGFLESSWSSIQNLASSFLGNDSKWGKPGPASTYPTKRRKPSRSDIPVSLRQTGPSSWGPPITPTPQIGAGTKEERQAMVQAKKREVLLLANGDSLSDLRGQYKRKDSIEGPDTGTTDPEHDEEALVYIHHVKPSDTMTGLSIRYGCQLGIFRKANGFWPNDSIQTRKTVLLPAEACSVKGRRVNFDLLGDEPLEGGTEEDLGGSSIAPSETQPERRETQQSSDGNEQTWKHEAWVQMEGFPDPVEIGRVPRKTLGFFPRSRRKSLSVPYSDMEPSTPISASTSALERIDPSSPSNQRESSPYQSLSSSRLTSATHSPLKGGRTAHTRTGSITLRGPGGVGTLGREVHAPGPAQDGLNKFVSQHLPNLRVPQPPPSSSLRKSSFDSTSSALSGTSSTGLENVGGAIEGWMRKMALRAKTSLNEMQQGPQQGQQAFGIAGLGDLIELNDGLDGTTPPPASNKNNNDSRNGYFAGRHHDQATENSQYQRFSDSLSSMSRTRPRGNMENETYNKDD